QIRHFAWIGILQMKNPQLGHVRNAHVHFFDKILDARHDILRRAHNECIGALVGHGHNARICAATAAAATTPEPALISPSGGASASASAESTRPATSKTAWAAAPTIAVKEFL